MKCAMCQKRIKAGRDIRVEVFTTTEGAPPAPVARCCSFVCASRHIDERHVQIEDEGTS